LSDAMNRSGAIRNRKQREVAVLCNFLERKKLHFLCDARNACYNLGLDSTLRATQGPQICKTGQGRTDM